MISLMKDLITYDDMVGDHMMRWIEYSISIEYIYKQNRSIIQKEQSQGAKGKPSEAKSRSDKPKRSTKEKSKTQFKEKPSRATGKPSEAKSRNQDKSKRSRSKRRPHMPKRKSKGKKQ